MSSNIPQIGTGIHFSHSLFSQPQRSFSQESHRQKCFSQSNCSNRWFSARHSSGRLLLLNLRTLTFSRTFLFLTLITPFLLYACSDLQQLDLLLPCTCCYDGMRDPSPRFLLLVRTPYWYHLQFLSFSTLEVLKYFRIGPLNSRLFESRATILFPVFFEFYFVLITVSTLMFRSLHSQMCVGSSLQLFFNFCTLTWNFFLIFLQETSIII